jgi:hypothetical protein
MGAPEDLGTSQKVRRGDTTGIKIGMWPYGASIPPVSAGVRPSPDEGLFRECRKLPRREGVAFAGGEGEPPFRCPKFL